LLVVSPGCLPTGNSWAFDRRLDDGSRMSGDVHVRFCESAGVRFPRATHLIITFEREDDARRVMDVLGKRLERYGLALHPDKTRLLAFRRPPRGQQSGKGPGSFDFVGFTFYWGRTRTGSWTLQYKTRCARLRRSIRSVYAWCRRHRHWAVKEQRAALSRRLHGHYNYFGVNGNARCLQSLYVATKQAWRKWLGRRSQRGRLSWERMEDILRLNPGDARSVSHIRGGAGRWKSPSPDLVRAPGR
jgi:hypothetical protein